MGACPSWVISHMLTNRCSNGIMGDLLHFHVPAGQYRQLNSVKRVDVPINLRPGALSPDGSCLVEVSGPLRLSGLFLVRLLGCGGCSL